MRYLCDQLTCFDSDEEGAILILALAALLILLLLGMTLFDAGRAAHDKMETQAAADTAAYSQAAVKARSMNMMAYANISKRSIWGIHSLYPSYLKSTHRWIVNSINSNCKTCENQDPSSDACRKCRTAQKERDRWINSTCEELDNFDCDASNPDSWGLFRHLSGRDYGDKLTLTDNNTKIEDVDTDWADPWYVDAKDFGAKPTLDPNDPMKSLFEAYVAEDMRALDNYQRYIFGLTPWWGWTEQLVRAVRNGASMSSSWPAPVGAMPQSIGSSVNSIIQRFRGLFGGSASTQSPGYTLYADSLPVFPGTTGTMQSYLSDAVNNSSVRSCLRAILEGGSCSDHINPFLIEHVANALIFMIRSEGVVGAEYDNMDPVSGMAATLGIHYKAVFDDFVDVGLPYTANSFDNVLGDDRLVGEPWLLRPGKTEAHWQMSTSNIVMTYQGRYGSFDKQRDRKKFDFVEQDYRGNSLKHLVKRAQLYGTPNNRVLTGDELLSQELTYSASGYWAMARSEIFFNAAGDPDLWHPSWSSRLRPIAIDDEFVVADYTFNQVYHDAVGGFALAAALGITELSDIWTALGDLAFMEKATLSMGESTVEGVSK
ncbi:MAG: pilus assembly protein TadG-related protein [Persicimonas sp.]